MTPYTQLQAHAEVRETLAARQAEVLEMVRKHPGCTAVELAELRGYRDPNRIRPRLTELYKAGLVEPCGHRMCAVTHRAAMCWRVVTGSAQGELGL